MLSVFFLNLPSEEMLSHDMWVLLNNLSFCDSFYIWQIRPTFFTKSVIASSDTQIMVLIDIYSCHIFYEHYTADFFHRIIKRAFLLFLNAPGVLLNYSPTFALNLPTLTQLFQFDHFIDLLLQACLHMIDFFPHSLRGSVHNRVHRNFII